MFAALQLNQKLQTMANTVVAWVDAECVLKSDHWITREEAYTAYQQWVNADGTLGDPVSNRKFYQILRSLGCSVSPSDRERINGKQVSVIRGIDFK